MTEQEWLACADPMPMLGFLQDKASNRKLRLFSCACLRRVWHLLNDEPGRRAVDVSERYADGLLTFTEAYAIAQVLMVFCTYDLFERLSQETGFDWEAIGCAILAACLSTSQLDTNETANVLRAVAKAVGCQAVADDFDGDNKAYENAATMERAAQTRLLRDIFGNPFRPVALDPARLTTNVVALARTIYHDRAFGCLPLLADTLEDAGCTNAEMLAHCRQPGPHVRGCWAVDLVLGKK